MTARPLKILYMAHVRWFNAEAQYALDLAGECQRQGHNVFYYTQSGSPTVAVARAMEIRTFEEKGFNAKGLGGIFGIFPAVLRLVKILKQNQIDAVEVFRSEGFVVIALVCCLLCIPVVRVRGDMRPVRKGTLNRLLYKKVTSAVVASNTTIANGLRQRLGPMPLLKTIHGGVDADRFRPEGFMRDIRSEMRFPVDAFMVGILGRLGEQKGHGDLITAAEKLMTTNAKVFFVILAKENSSTAAELHKRIGSVPGLGGHFGFLDFQEDLQDVLRSFDLGVVASTASEANCRVGLEWMASGVPLIGTRIGVLPDLIDAGQTGFLVPPRAPERLAERIGHLTDVPGRAQRMGSKARQRVLKYFTIQTCAEKHLELIEEFI